MGIADCITLYLDGADLDGCRRYASQVKGFTTNPSLMRQAGITSYAAFADQMLEIANGKSVSFEVIADELDGMDRQARWLASLAPNVYVKIPITNAVGICCLSLIDTLSADGIPVNVTAVMTHLQIEQALTHLHAHSVLSVFAGRIADTGRDPVSFIRQAMNLTLGTFTKVMWASPREVLNVYQAAAAGCDLITCTPALLDKISLEGKDLAQYSLETVQMFRRDALAANLTIPTYSANLS